MSEDLGNAYAKAAKQIADLKEENATLRAQLEDARKLAAIHREQWCHVVDDLNVKIGRLKGRRCD